MNLPASKIEGPTRDELVFALDPYYRDFVQRLRSAVKFTESIRQSAEWIEQNTTYPGDEDKKFTFYEHEYQIDICNDDAEEQVTQKCSQVGASEIAVRRMMAFMGMLSGVTTIYTMPSAGPASKFCKQRIDPPVKACPPLYAMLNKDVNSTAMKQFGSNFLHVSGTFGAVNAISVPTRILIKDETNFSNSTILGKFKSRMSHNKPGEALDISFSTPTQPDVGVSKSLELSDMKYYHVLHDDCGEWVMLHYERNCVVIPGFNDYLVEEGESVKTIMDWEADDVDNSDYDIDAAWYKCPKCEAEVTRQNLCDPSKRKWIATRKAKISGRQIFPHDVPAYNTLPKILRSLNPVTGYELKSDWVNFCIGLPYNDSSTKFQLNNIRSNLAGPEVLPAEGCATGTVAGLDTGKTSWITIGQPTSSGLKVIYAERILNSEDGTYLRDRTLQLCGFFGVICLVVDTAPDITAFRQIKDRNPENHTFGCQYTKSRSRKAVNFEIDEVEQLVNAYRTGTLTLLCENVNSQSVQFCDLKELPTVISHLQAVTRVAIYSEEGEAVYRWINGRKPDHFTHSLNYLRLAKSIAQTVVAKVPSPVNLLVRTVNMNKGEEPMSLMDHQRSRNKAMTQTSN